jgi:hypothetical protein
MEDIEKLADRISEEGLFRDDGGSRSLANQGAGFGNRSCDMTGNSQTLE